VALPFLLQPNLTAWTFPSLILVYSFEGVGRATFEGTLKATFADYFAYEKEGAYANIILQNGLSSSVAYYLSFQMTCQSKSSYCIEYQDGSLHNLLGYGSLVVFISLAAIVGYWRSSYLYQREGTMRSIDSTRVTRASMRALRTEQTSYDSVYQQDETELPQIT
jgi:hypothetical protein